MISRFQAKKYRIWPLWVSLLAPFSFFGQVVERLEYFINTDPGFGSATAISITPAENLNNIQGNINLENIPYGLNRIYIRSLAGDHWSVTQSTPFFKLNADGGNVVKAEYFINVDPGFGNAISIPITPGDDIDNFVFPVNISDLAMGMHRIYIRAFDGTDWSITHQLLFFKGINPGAPINRVEYFIDADPGFGLATPVAITPGVNLSEISFTIPIEALDYGIHFLYIRSFVEDASSITQLALFFKSAQPNTDITYAEYFIDNDPGFGNGNAISLDASPDIIDINLPVDISGLSDGEHLLFVRSRNANGEWSITNIRPFVSEGNLPVTWGPFSAEPNMKDMSIDLRWITFSESNTAWFSIERNKAGSQHYDSIGKVAAAGESTLPLTYTFRDFQAMPGVPYAYRIKQMDKDGKYSYSTLRVATLMTLAKQIKVSPTFVTSGKIRIENGETGQEWKIINMQGQTMGAAKLNDPLETVQLPGQLSKGMYFIVVTDRGRIMHTEKIVIQ